MSIIAHGLLFGKEKMEVYMTIMTKPATQAVAKLERERKDIPVIKESEIGQKLRGNGAADAKASLMADAVLKVLSEFCSQSEVFAKAVIAGGTFKDCMKAAAQGLGNYAEGSEVCKKCVEFYLPGAQIHVQWRVEVPAEGTEKAAEQVKQDSFMLDLMDLLK